MWYLCSMHTRFLLYFFIASLFFSCGDHKGSDHHHEDEHHADEGVVIEPEQALQFGILTETITPGEFHDVIKTSGSIEASSSEIFTATARRSGIITLSPGINRGVEVKKGQNLASISSEGVQGGDINKAAQTNMNAAKAEYERLKPLFEEGLVTASAFREAERAYREAEALAGSEKASGSPSVSSPASGNILELYVRSGEFVETGTPIASIGKNATQVLRVDLPSRESRHLGEISTANFVPEGSTEVLSLKELDGKKISGSIPQSSNGYIPVYFSFTGNPATISGGYAEVYLICSQRDRVISVPREALVEIQGNRYIYVATGDHSYDKRLVTTGASDGERVEILEGLNAGEKVVTKGASVVRMAEVSSIAPPAHSH